MKKFRIYIENLGYSFKKEILLLLSINGGILFFTLIIYFLFSLPFILIIGGILILIFNFLTFFKYSKKKESDKFEHNLEIVNLMTYFSIFISNNFNVYSSLNLLNDYSSPFLKERLDILLNAIDKDKSVQPYVDFAKNFDAPFIENLFISIYQMSIQGEKSNRLNEFESLFNKLENDALENKKEKKKRMIDNFSVFPLVGAAYISILILLGVILILGKMMNNVI